MHQGEVSTQTHYHVAKKSFYQKRSLNQMSTTSREPMENNAVTSSEDPREDGCYSHRAATQRDEATCRRHDEELEEGGNAQTSPDSTSSDPRSCQLPHAQAHNSPEDQDQKSLPEFEPGTGGLGQERRDTKRSSSQLGGYKARHASAQASDKSIIIPRS